MSMPVNNAADTLPLAAPEPRVQPGRKLAAMLAETRIGDGEGFATRAVSRLALGHAGIDGDHHAGFTRTAGGREPWYPRGTEIRSGRQVSIVCPDELAAVAAALGIPAVDPGLIGANLVLSGVPRLSFLPAGTRIFLEGGASLVVEGQNAPCRYAGAALGSAHPGREDIETGFVAAARRRRGLVASVERPGEARAGTAVTLRIPEQWIWAP